MPGCGSDAAISEELFLQVPRGQTGQWCHCVCIVFDGGHTAVMSVIQPQLPISSDFNNVPEMSVGEGTWHHAWFTVDAPRAFGKKGGREGLTRRQHFPVGAPWKANPLKCPRKYDSATELGGVVPWLNELGNCMLRCPWRFIDYVCVKGSEKASCEESWLALFIIHFSDLCDPGTLLFRSAL